MRSSKTHRPRFVCCPPRPALTDGALRRSWVEGQIEGSQGVAADEEPAGVLMVLVVRIFARQQNTGVEEPQVQGSGLLALTSAATSPPQPVGLTRLLRTVGAGHGQCRRAGAQSWLFEPGQTGWRAHPAPGRPEVISARDCSYTRRMVASTPRVRSRASISGLSLVRTLPPGSMSSAT